MPGEDHVMQSELFLYDIPSMTGENAIDSTYYWLLFRIMLRLVGSAYCSVQSICIADDIPLMRAEWQA
jgi:hypothetical protein